MSKEGNVKLAQGALNELIKCAGSCEDRDKLEEEAVRVFEKLANHKPLIKRACEAFNSNKAVCYLSKHADADRGNDFAILNPDRIIEKIGSRSSQRALKKAAALHPVFYANKVDKSPEKVITKAASGFDPLAEIRLNINPEVLEIGIINQLDRHEEILNKLACGRDMAEHRRIKALEKLARALSHISTQEKSDILSICNGHYGSLLDNDFKQLFDSTEPLRKFASAPKVPSGGVYDVIEDYMAASMVKEARDEKFMNAAKDTADLLKKLAGAYHLQRKTAGLSSSFSDAISSEDVKKTLGLSSDSPAEVLRTVLTPNLRNTLSELELKRTFFDILDDDYISTFPIEDVQSAFNAAIQKLPTSARMQPSMHSAILRSWVSKYLSHGGTTSAEDSEDALKAARYLSGYGIADRITDDEKED